MRKDYYLILHVTAEASFEQIRSAYRRRALELHPDLTGLGSEQFLELQEAYNVLSNPDRRKVYDLEADETPLRRANAMRSPEDIIGAGIELSRSSELNRRASLRIYPCFDHSKRSLRPSISCLNGCGATSICIRDRRRSGWKV
ncbi:MAG TPA: J domain-containing protein [Chthoniobacterales bacterium]|nr:J domain-containing protein [Chthoniobacterales bacterium]